MGRVDSDAILAEVDIVEVISKYVSLSRNGNARDYKGICPFHDDHSDSLEVSEKKQIFKCFPCGAGGDAFEFLKLQGIPFLEAVKMFKGGEDLTGTAVKRAAKPKKPRPVWEQVRPVPADAKPPKLHHYAHGVPSYIWEYKDTSGALVGYTCRFDLEDGGKEVLPYIYATDGSKSEWRWQGFEKPRSLYNAQELALKPDATVIVFEGEKTTDAGANLIPSAVCVSWIGGANGVHLTDWTPLHGRKVIFWPDNDAQGFSAMLHINELLEGKTAFSKWIKNPEDAPKGWDVADSDFSQEAAIKYARQNAHAMPQPATVQLPKEFVEKNGEPVKVWTNSEFDLEYVYGFFKIKDAVEWRFLKAPGEVAPAPEYEELTPDKPEFEPIQLTSPSVYEPEIKEEEDEEGAPFKFLGFNKSESGGLAFYFYVIRPKTVIRLTASGIGKTTSLIQLAPLDWWEHRFSGKQGLNINMAVNYLVAGGMEAGPYKDQLVRGRGAWMDAGRVILHAGDRLIVNGAPMALGTLETKFIYEWGGELGFNVVNPLKKEAASQLIDLLNLLNWEREINAYLLAGWCVVAPICGALNWRPHIWLTGGAGTGKSWVFSKIVRPLLGETAVAVQGDATEAGLRQTLQSDALPVVFDEAEGENPRSQARIQTVLGLMRAASSSDGGLITKGSGTGVAKTYRIRSCFAFASIAVQLVQQSDRSRVTVLGLKKSSLEDAEKAQAWKDIQAAYVKTITSEFIDGLQARTIKLLPIITENAKIFSAAAAAELGEQRSGDQIGTLLAGAYSLRSDSLITYEKALEWIRARDWSEEKALDQTKDELACFNYILGQTVKVETELEKYLDRTIGELILIASDLAFEPNIPAMKAAERLRRFGIKIDSDFVVVSNSAKSIKDALEKTPWANNHNKILLRVDGARQYDATTFIAGSLKTRAVGIPLQLLKP